MTVRQIINGFLIGNEVVRGLRRRGGHGFLFKIDFHTAFDLYSLMRLYILTIRSVSFPCKYLGLPLRANPSKKFNLEAGSY